MSVSAFIERLEQVLCSLAPCGAPLTIREHLHKDESKWFLAGADAKVFTLGECPSDCFRLKERGLSGPDHFDTPAGKPRHIFSKPNPDIAFLNREYVPHLAAYSRLILELGYSRERSAFSFYRRFTKDLITKRQGQSFETDAEFYDRDGRVYLQVEAKQSPRKTERLATEMRRAGSLAELPLGTAKEVEYVLDLAPDYLWVVGPGSIDPASFIFRVETTGLNAVFQECAALPAPPA